jgi:hypothetical protein
MRQADGSPGVAAEEDVAAAPIDPIGLVEPTYLDVDMLATYVASLENGVSFVTRETRRASAERHKEVKGGFRIPGLSALGVEGGTGGGQGQDLTTEQERRHTPSSLFVKLRASLVYERNAVRAVTSADDARDLEPGDLVEVSGELIADPLVTVLDALADAGQMMQDLSKVKLLTDGLDNEAKARLSPTWPFPPPAAAAVGSTAGIAVSPGVMAGHGQTSTRRQERQVRGSSGAPFSLSEAIVQSAMAMDNVRMKVKAGPVADYVMQVRNSPLRVVLPLSRKYLADGREHQTEGGYFTVLGTVTRNLAGDESISLVRRSVFGVLPRGWIEKAYTYMKDSQLNLMFPELIITAPALQLLPLAIYA